MDIRARSVTIPARALDSVSWAVDASRRASSVIYPAVTALLGDLRKGPSSADALMSAHAHTFRFAARFLPEHHREPTINLYAFFRTLDDLVDEQPGTAETLKMTEREIDAWQGWFETGMVKASPREEIGSTLAEVVQTRGIDRRYFLDFLDGMRADLRPRQPESKVQVERYGYQVASTVGLAMAHLFGATSPPALNAAIRLGIAMQLTNILRDIGGDLARGRLYLPVDLLDRHHLDRAAVETLWRSGKEPDDRLRAAISQMVEWADDHYTAGIDGLSLLPRDVQMPILLAARLYQRILRQLESGGYDSLRTRAATTRWQKVREACNCLVQPVHDESLPRKVTR